MGRGGGEGSEGKGAGSRARAAHRARGRARPDSKQGVRAEGRAVRRSNTTRERREKGALPTAPAAQNDKGGYS